MASDNLCWHCEQLGRFTNTPSTEMDILRANLVASLPLPTMRSLESSPCPLCRIYWKMVKAQGILDEDVVLFNMPVLGITTVGQHLSSLEMLVRVMKGQGIGLKVLKIFSHPGKSTVTNAHR